MIYSAGHCLHVVPVSVVHLRGGMRINWNKRVTKRQKAQIKDMAEYKQR